MDSYMVRIYRQEEDNSRMFVGTVQKVGTEAKEVFSTLDELWSILNHEKKKGVRGKKETANNGNRGKKGS